MNSLMESLIYHRGLIHYSLHLIFPVIPALVIFKNRWWKAYLIMVCTMVVDLDHLLADPIYNPNRCSIGYHVLHSYPAIMIYTLFTALPKTRMIGTGLVLHMLTDYIDCILMKL